MPLFALTIYWYWSLKGRTNRGHKSTEFTLFDNSLMKEKILSKDHNLETNGDSNQWQEWPAIVKSNLKSILVFVKHPPPPPSSTRSSNSHNFYGNSPLSNF